MNNLLRALMDAPSVHADVYNPVCVVCGSAFPHLESHHVVPRSQGGTNGPTMDLCSAGGNILRDINGRITCHGAAHHRLLHFKYEDDTWWYLITEEPMKFEKALELDGWKPISPQCDADWEPPF